MGVPSGSPYGNKPGNLAPGAGQPVAAPSGAQPPAPSITPGSYQMPAMDVTAPPPDQGGLGGETPPEQAQGAPGPDEAAFLAEASAPSAPSGPTDPSEAAFLADAGGNSAPPPANQVDLTDRSGGTLLERFKNSFGRTPEEHEAFLKTAYKEVKKDSEGEFLVRNDPKEKFKKFNSEGVKSAFEVLQAIVGAGRGIVEGAVATPIDAAMTAVGGLTGGPVGAALGYGAGAVAGGAAGNEAGNAIGKALGVPLKEQSTAQRLTDDALAGGTNLVVKGGLGVVGGALKSGAKIIKAGYAPESQYMTQAGKQVIQDAAAQKIKLLPDQANPESPTLAKTAEKLSSDPRVIAAKAEQAKQLKSGLEHTFDNAGVNHSQGVAQLGEETSSAVDQLRSKLGKRIGSLQQHADEIIKKTKQQFKISNIMKTYQEVLSRAGVEFDAMGNISDRGYRPQTILGLDEEKSRGLIHEFTKLQVQEANGGLTPVEIRNLEDRFAALAKHDSGTSDKATAFYRALDGAASADKNAAYTATLHGTPEGGLYQNAIDNFKSKIDSIKAIQALADKSPEEFVNKLLTNVQMARHVKTALSDRPDIFNKVKRQYFAKIMHEVTDNFTNEISGSKLISKIESIGGDMLDELLTKEQRENLGQQARIAQAIEMASRRIKAPMEGHLGEKAVKALVSHWNVVKADFLMTLFHKHPDVLEYLADEGLTKYTVGKDAPLRHRALEIVHQIRDYLDNTNTLGINTRKLLNTTVNSSRAGTASVLRDKKLRSLITPRRHSNGNSGSPIQE